MISEVEGDNSLSVNIGWHLVTRLAVSIYVTVIQGHWCDQYGYSHTTFLQHKKKNQPASI